MSVVSVGILCAVLGVVVGCAGLLAVARIASRRNPYAPPMLRWPWRSQPTVSWMERRHDELTARAQAGVHKPSRVGELLHQAVYQSPTAIVVVDREENVIFSNTTSHELGIVHERKLSRIAWGAALSVFTDGQPHQVDLTPSQPTNTPAEGRSRRPVFSVRGTAQLLNPPDLTHVVIYALDDTETVRMEKARRDFVANVSHELKTPVGAVQLLVEALMQSRGDQEAVDYFSNQLLTEATKMSQLINELIDLSKLQGAEALPDMELVSIDDVIAEAIERCRVAAEQGGISLTTDGPIGALVRGDRQLLVTAVSNLITNAINYSPEATPVSVTRALAGDVVHIRVTDRGIGIAPEFQDRVFERFFRVDDARTRTMGGTGLGLAIVKHVAVNHGGAVRLWSKPGTGSTFTLELPMEAGTVATRRKGGKSAKTSLQGKGAKTSLPGKSAKTPLPGKAAKVSLPGKAAEASLPGKSAKTQLPGKGTEANPSAHLSAEPQHPRGTSPAAAPTAATPTAAAPTAATRTAATPTAAARSLNVDDTKGSNR